MGNTQGGVNLDEIHKEFYNVLNLPVQKACAKDVCAQCDVVFLALPHKSAMEFVKALREAQKNTESSSHTSTPTYITPISMHAPSALTR